MQAKEYGVVWAPEKRGKLGIRHPPKLFFFCGGGGGEEKKGRKDYRILIDSIYCGNDGASSMVSDVFITSSLQMYYITNSMELRRTASVV
jgi:hypothetical protein